MKERKPYPTLESRVKFFQFGTTIEVLPLVPKKKKSIAPSIAL